MIRPEIDVRSGHRGGLRSTDYVETEGWTHEKDAHGDPIAYASARIDFVPGHRRDALRLLARSVLELLVHPEATT